MINPTTPVSNVYNSYNQFIGIGYDAAGNQQVANGDTLTYDAENRLVTASDPVTGNTACYLYDGQGNRVVKGLIQNGTCNPSIVYVYDAMSQLSAEYSALTTPASAPCQTCFLSYDHLGSVRLVTDQSSKVVAKHDYLPFGEEIQGGTDGRDANFGAIDTISQRFTGQERNTETGLDYFGARYYGSALGRFTSPVTGAIKIPEIRRVGIFTAMSATIR